MIHLIVGGVCGVALLALLIFPGFRKKLKVLCGGFLNIFVEDMAKTPDGAKAIYSQAIEEAENAYRDADSAYKRVYGEYKNVETEIKTLDNQIYSAESRAEALVRDGKIEEAKTFALQRSESMELRAQKAAYLEKLTSMVEDAKLIHRQAGDRLQKLKKESRLVVEEMKLNQNMNRMVSDLDDLRRDTATDKMLGAVRDGAKDLRKEAVGSMAVHQNRSSTKQAVAQQAAADVEAEAFLASMQAKYKTGAAAPSARDHPVVFGTGKQ